MRSPRTSPRLTIDAELTLAPPTVADAADGAAAQDDECAHWFDWPGRPTTARCAAYLQEASTSQ